MASLKRRIGTRSTLAVALIAAFALPVVGIAVAQTPGAPTIELLNPSGHSAIISDKATANSDGTYRLSAWAANVPNNPAVEFELATTAGVVLHTMGPATQVSADTWEFQWNIPSARPDGTYLLRARLYSGLQEVDFDEQEVQLLHGSQLEEMAAERAEITFPDNGGSPGFYIPPNVPSANGVIDVTTTDGTTFVRVWYSTDAPGTEPQWTTCGTQSRGASGDGLRCTLAEGVHPSMVTALAIAANTSNPDIGFQNAFTESGDAIRVDPYIQVPTSITTSAAQVTQVDGCVDEWLTADVLDQSNRPIGAANIDVHAKGPADSLKFWTSNESGRPGRQAPDSGGHTYEPGVDCNGTLTTDPGSPGPDQGEHNNPVEPDRKHIESTAGTNDAGHWEFNLTSPDEGDTQITVWVDIADNDTYCGNDPAAHTAVRWVEDPDAVDENGDPVHSPAPVQPQGTEASDCPAPPPFGTPPPTTTPTSPSPTPTDGDVVESGPCAGFPRDSQTPRDGGNGFVIVGTEGDDVLEGSDGDDIICGLGGDDDIRGLGGDDSIYGGSGADTIRGNQGNDMIVGGGGHDTLSGGKNADTIRGGQGNDVIRGGKGPDVLQGGRGHDIVRGGAGHDTLNGGRGNDELYGGRGDDFLNGGRGSDLCRGGAGRDSFRNCER